MTGTLKQANITDAIHSFSVQAPTYIDARVLAATTNESHTIPSGAKWVVFSADGDFYALVGGTAAIPGADVTDGTASQLNPTVWYLEGETAIGLIASATRVVTMAFYA